MPFLSVRLQPPMALKSTSKQAADFAIDVQGYVSVVVQVRVVVNGGTGSTLVLQHSPVLDEASFQDIVASDTWNLASPSTPNITKAYVNVHRYIRWSGVRAGGGTDPVFVADLLARST